MVAKRLSKSKILRFNRKRENGNVSKGVYQKYSFVQEQDSELFLSTKKKPQSFFILKYNLSVTLHTLSSTSMLMSVFSNHVTVTLSQHHF